MSNKSHKAEHHTKAKETHKFRLMALLERQLNLCIIMYTSHSLVRLMRIWAHTKDEGQGRKPSTSPRLVYILNLKYLEWVWGFLAPLECLLEPKFTSRKTQWCTDRQHSGHGLVARRFLFRERGPGANPGEP